MKQLLPAMGLAAAVVILGLVVSRSFPVPWKEVSEALALLAGFGIASRGLIGSIRSTPLTSKAVSRRRALYASAAIGISIAIFVGADGGLSTAEAAVFALLFAAWLGAVLMWRRALLQERQRLDLRT